MLYHLNVGPPFLEAGSRIVAPARSIAPFTSRATEGIDTFDTYAGPQAGFAEQVYVYDLVADSAGRTLAMLYNATADRGIVLRMNRNEVPCFTVWKNTAAVEDGYVTGLEPGTNFPNFKSFERERGRVKVLPAGSRWECTWSLEVLDSAASVSAILAEIVSPPSPHPRRPPPHPAARVFTYLTPALARLSRSQAPAWERKTWQAPPAVIPRRAKAGANIITRRSLAEPGVIAFPGRSLGTRGRRVASPVARR